MIYRKLSKYIETISAKFPVVTVTGPRQSGKTTLLKAFFKNHSYFNFEELDIRDWATNDPRGFLEENRGPLILDEIQKVPNLFSYLQPLVDKNNIPGQYILSGSQSFLLNEKIAQTLAGRAAILELLPFSWAELDEVVKKDFSENEYIFKGSFPRIYDQEIEPKNFFPSYIRTYVERDVRLIKNIVDVSLFQRFLKLCAGRIGQLLNISSLASDCGISVNTAKGWLSVLEQSYIIFLLRPHFQNFNKRMVKMPKLYFYDTGLACSLLEIEKSSQLNSHYSRGNLFENMIILELLKNRFNSGMPPNLYFWRNNHGNEIDCIINKPVHSYAIEIKSGKTFSSSFLKGLEFWKKISDQNKNLFLIYSGDMNRKYNNIQLMNWKKVKNING